MSSAIIDPEREKEGLANILVTNLYADMEHLMMRADGCIFRPKDENQVMTDFTHLESTG